MIVLRTKTFSGGGEELENLKKMYEKLKNSSNPKLREKAKKIKERIDYIEEGMKAGRCDAAGNRVNNDNGGNPGNGGNEGNKNYGNYDENHNPYDFSKKDLLSISAVLGTIALLCLGFSFYTQYKIGKELASGEKLIDEKD